MPNLWEVSKRKSFHHGRVLKNLRVVTETIFKNIWSLPWDYFKQENTQRSPKGSSMMIFLKFVTIQRVYNSQLNHKQTLIDFHVAIYKIKSSCPLIQRLQIDEQQRCKSHQPVLKPLWPCNSLKIAKNLGVAKFHVTWLNWKIPLHF